ncbi:hypothetical protein H6F95_23975 [Cyanobacteria bacterium FACHB-471]|nr:hypothetical protein [Cyanobacteria bacterium FACHB-471]
MAQKKTLSYSQHFETLVALVTHLAVVSGNEADAANALKLAQRLGLDKQEVISVLDNFKGLFRRTEKPYPTKNYGLQYKYSLQLRYARRKYVDSNVVNAGEALTNEELLSLFTFITNKVNEEQETARQAKENKITMIGVWVAAMLSLVSTVVSLYKS